jgi:hypothetical protein
MNNFLPTALFWIAVVAALVAQVAILRSTARAWRRAAGPVPVVERVFAWGPALVIVIVLFLAWKEATKPPMIEVQFDPTTRGIIL